MMRSRKGDAFLLVLDFLFLVAIITLFVTIAMEFRKQNPDEPLGVHQAAMLRTYASADDLLIALDVIAKREALIAIRDVARSGATIITDTRCGTYAGLERWNSPDGKTCFPAQKVYEAFRGKLQDRLRVTASPSMPYELTLTSEGDTLRIGGTGTRDVTLPILLTTDGDQRAASALLSQNTVPSTTFSPDTRLEATVRPIPGGTPRSSSRASAIIIHATRTSTAADALAQYDGGSLGAHYLIDEDGRLTQLVREDLRVRNLVACDTVGACAIDGLEDTSIAIAIVAPQELPPQADACQEGFDRRDAPQWCGTESYPAPANGCAQIGGPVCVMSASQAQRDTLNKLVADIARRRDIPVRADTVFLEEQVSPVFPLATLALVPVAEEERAWWSRFIALASVTAKTPVIEETPKPLSSGGAPQLDLPIDGDLRVSSCFGWRTVNGKPDLHDGIDFAGDGNEVLAAADGVVYAVCENGRCDGIPARYSGFGNNIIIAHDGGIYTRYSHLSAITIKTKDRVIRGQAIGVSGNTGRSFGAHLDFKVYVSEQAIPEVGGAGDKAVEPLCFFPSDAFGKLTFNTGSDSCKQYGGETVSPDNERLRATCARFDVQPQPTCGIGTAPTSITADDPTIKRTIERLDAIPGLRAQIATSASENGIDELLVLALITQESKGDPNAVSWTGCAGIGQFCKGTAELEAFKEIFGPGLRTCDCPGQGSSCDAQMAGCLGDPRLDPIKSAQAIPLHLALDAKTFQDYQDRWRFAIASYNAGSPAIRQAIRKSGKSDPTWEEIVPHLRDATGSSTKTEEVVGYVARVTGYWAALGGDTTPSQIGITCTAITPTSPLGTQVTVREVGSYTFTPSFSVAVPNGLAPIVGVSATAQAILNTCDGRGGSDPNACFTRETRERFGDRAVSCAPGNEAILQDLREFVADCRTSGQRGCGCAWDAPTLPDGVEEARLDLYGTDARLIINSATYGSPAGARATRVTAIPNGEPRDAILSIVIERDGERTKTSLVTWRVASGAQEGEDGADDELQVENVQEVDRVFLRPDGTWFTNDAPACAPYKREHALCVDLGTTTVLPNGSVVPLVARFALWLKDLEIPTTVSDIKAATPTAGGYMAVRFQPSASADVSHYRIWCAPANVGVDEAKPYTMTNMTQTVVRSCNGESVVPGPYTVRVVPYDIAGQRGEATEAGTVDETDTGWLGVLGGLGDGFTQEEFFDAFVTYYTGGLATTP